MIALLPGRGPETALEALRSTRQRFENVQSATSPQARYDGYLLSAAESQRTLANAYGQDAIEALVLGPTFHTFTTGNYLAFGSSTIAILDHELRYRIDLLATEQKAVEEQIRLWTYVPPVDTFADHRLHALVLDTGVLEEHHDRSNLAELAPKWLMDAAGVEGGQRLGIAAVTLEEIDRHKNTGNQKMHGTETLLKTAARASQKLLAELYNAGPRQPLLDVSRHSTFIGFQERRLDHSPLPIADNEVIAYALELEPFAASVTFVSYDLGPCITARQQGLLALQLQYT